ncbi:MAG: Fpg/Nei family DNA glycosylase [Nocardioidaceae bacterium]|nr:Fpg/Nei family DNA glycosylase [Nocardioidaceae bacterium]
MPEGHTLFRLAADFQRVFGERAVEASSPQGRFAESAASIDGRVVESAESAGKHLFVRFDDDQILHVHLGLIGAFAIGAGPPPAPVGAVRLRLVGPTSYADLRGAITCELISTDKLEQVLGGLGPDPLRSDADPDRAFARIRKSGKPIGALLLDQRVVAGVGNVFRAELLFRARLHPLTPGVRVSKRRWNGIWADLVDLMVRGVETGRIDTVRPEHVDHGGEVYVYRRQGRPCHVCSSMVRTQVLQGRNLFWCPTCQRRR